MRRTKEEAAETRRRIVAKAAEEFRAHGVEGIGISDLMGKLGLTHGGFYRHFESKDQLLAEACRHALDRTVSELGETADKAPKGQGLETALRQYLRPLHRDHPDKGCALAAIGGEVARTNERSRAAMTEGFHHLVDTIARQLPDLPPTEAETRALAIVSGMVGALLLSRLVDDEALSSRLLRAARQHLATIGDPDPATDRA
ncbi:transcriptional regulator, TetR family [Enhydrobacter aerosaccus]|uniref:Transcriptional regulator, TetR family n=1 Tax=Enhydrobacter aerosaccus TaxID=225324 RepID=A0A1T4TM63_9HYPH|nr:TetR/AcrR family transcriptional regulator [Enhydrobacter aerosaccus]SKA41540.1 transcriptional regulator, TetR family [Enhydrobacter aerosaccus]